MNVTKPPKENFVQERLDLAKKRAASEGRFDDAALFNEVIEHLLITAQANAELEAFAITADWQNEVRHMLINACVKVGYKEQDASRQIDGTGTDAGPFELTSAEIGIGIRMLVEMATVLTKFDGSAFKQIIGERCKQVHELGFTPEHDDHHIEGELADAAACFASTQDDLAYFAEVDPGDANYCPHANLWPTYWDKKWNQRDTDSRITQLVKAGALIVAEISRLQRLESKSKEGAA